MGAKLLYTGIDVTPKYVEPRPNAGRPIQTQALKWRPHSLSRSLITSFDIVFNSGMLIHIDNPVLAMREFVRVASKAILLEATADKYQLEDL